MLFFDDFVNIVSIMCMWSKGDLLQGVTRSGYHPLLSPPYFADGDVRWVWWVRGGSGVRGSGGVRVNAWLWWRRRDDLGEAERYKNLYSCRGERDRIGNKDRG